MTLSDRCKEAARTDPEGTYRKLGYKDELKKQGGKADARPHIDAQQVKQYWRLLNHDNYGCTEVVLIDDSGKLLIGFFNAPDALASALRPHAEKHIYAGNNPRPATWADNQFKPRKHRATDTDIQTVCSVVLDVDPTDREKGTLGTPQQHNAALATATSIATHSSAAVIDSGGGAYIWLAFESRGVQELGGAVDFKAKVKAWQRQLAQHYTLADQGLEIDTTQDLVHIYRLAGTDNHKPDPAATDGKGAGRPCRIIKMPSEPADKALAEILAIKVEQTPETSGEQYILDPQAEPPADKFQGLTARAIVQGTWDCKREDRPDWTMSEYQASLALSAAKAGWGGQEITDLLIAHRRHHEADPKLRQSYYGPTVNRALALALEGMTDFYKPRTVREEEPPEPRPARDDLLNAALPSMGFLANWLDYSTATTEAPKQFCFAVGLSVMATAIGRTAYLGWGDVRLYPNLYIALIGEQGRPRKTTAVTMGQTLISHCFPSIPETAESKARLGRVIPWDVSVEGLVEAYSQTPCGLTVAGELSALLAVTNRSYNIGMAQLLCSLFDCPYEHTRMLKSGLVVIPEPAPNIIGASTLVWLAEQTSQQALEGGLLSRFLYFFASRSGELKPLRPVADQKKFNSLKSFLMKTLLGSLNGGREMSFEPDALAAYENFYYELNEKPPEGALAGFFSRLTVSSIKLSMLYQLSNCPTCTEITLESWQYAEALIRYLQAGAEQFVGQAGASPDTQLRERILAKILAQPGIKHSDLLNGIRGLSADDFKRHFATLQQAEKVTARGTIGGRGDDARSYWPGAKA